MRIYFDSRVHLTRKYWENIYWDVRREFGYWWDRVTDNYGAIGKPYDPLGGIKRTIRDIRHIECKSHYPINNWTRIKETLHSVTYECPRCHQIKTIKLSHREVEMVPDRVHKDREKYAKSLVQPFRGGEFSREFAVLYPEKTQKMIKNGVVSRQEVEKSKPVWKGEPNYNHLKKTY